MNLADVLRDVRNLAFDTAVLIYFIERSATYFDRMLAVMRRVDDLSISGMSASIAMTEVQIHPIRTGNTALIDQLRYDFDQKPWISAGTAYH